LLEPEPVRLVIKKKDEGGDAERKDVVDRVKSCVTMDREVDRARLGGTVLRRL